MREEGFSGKIPEFSSKLWNTSPPPTDVYTNMFSAGQSKHLL